MATRILKQDEVANNLTEKAADILRDRVELPMRRRMKGLWAVARADIKAHLKGLLGQAGGMNEEGKYESTPGTAAAVALKPRAEDYIRHRTAQFKREAAALVAHAKSEAYRLQILLSHWVLDQVTPPNVKVRPKRYSYEPDEPREFKEAMANPITGEEPTPDAPKPSDRVGAWTDAWGLGLMASLGIVLVRGGDPDDAGQSVDRTKADGYEMDGAMDKLIASEVNVAVDDAASDTDDWWGNIIKRWTWKTIFGTGEIDSVVCPVCKSRNGRTMTDALWEKFPAHPHCRCKPMVQPEDWRKLAADLGRPSADARDMVIIDKTTGKPIASVVVDFDVWHQSIMN